MKKLPETDKRLLNYGLTQAASGAVQYLLPEYLLVHNCLLFSYYPSSTRREIKALLAEKLAGLFYFSSLDKTHLACVRYDS